MTTDYARCRCHSQDLYDEIGYFWDLIVVFCFLLVLILVPLDSVMPRPESRISGLFWMINVVFFVDALLVSMRFKVPPAATSMKTMFSLYVCVFASSAFVDTRRTLSHARIH